MFRVNGLRCREIKIPGRIQRSIDAPYVSIRTRRCVCTLLSIRRQSADSLPTVGENLISRFSGQGLTRGGETTPRGNTWRMRAYVNDSDKPGIRPGCVAILDECPSTELTSTSGRLSGAPRKQVLLSLLLCVCANCLQDTPGERTSAKASFD